MENKIEIKIGREIYIPKKGDYILDNGSCYQFCSGDNRTLKQEGFNSYRNLKMRKKTIKSYDLENPEKFEKKISKVSTVNTPLTYYIFK